MFHNDWTILYHIHSLHQKNLSGQKFSMDKIELFLIIISKDESLGMPIVHHVQFFS